MDPALLQSWREEDAALETQWTKEQSDIGQAIDITERVTGSNARSQYIVAVAASGGLAVARQQGEVRAFCCLDHRYFFERPFVSLLIVDMHFRRCGLGSRLLSFSGDGLHDVWTSTNRSNAPMRSVLAKTGWQFCGEVVGLAPGDPELFFTKSKARQKQH